MSPEAMLLAAGILFTAIAIVGGGFSAKEVAVPVVPIGGRIASAAIALGFFIGAGYLIGSGRPAPSSVGDPAAGAVLTPEPSRQPTAQASPPTSTSHASTTPLDQTGAVSTPAEDESVPTLQSDQEILTSFLPEYLRPHCSRSDFGLSKLGTRASLECQPELDVLAVDFHWFASRERMHDVLRQDVESAAPDSVNRCSHEHWSYFGTWPEKGGAKGQILCFVRRGEARVVWTYDAFNVFAHAVQLDGDVSKLYGWWERVSSDTGSL